MQHTIDKQTDGQTLWTSSVGATPGSITLTKLHYVQSSSNSVHTASTSDAVELSISKRKIETAYQSITKQQTLAATLIRAHVVAFVHGVFDVIAGRLCV